MAAADDQAAALRAQLMAQRSGSATGTRPPRAKTPTEGLSDEAKKARLEELKRKKQMLGEQQLAPKSPQAPRPSSAQADPAPEAETGNCSSHLLARKSPWPCGFDLWGGQLLLMAEYWCNHAAQNF